MFEVLSPLSGATRVSRKVDAENFVAKQGIWAAMQADGSVANVATGVPAILNKLIIGVKSDSSMLYESNDVKVNRITTLETPGIKCECDSEVCVLTGLSAGIDLVVSAEAGAEGKLAATSQVADGDYEVVGRVLTVVSGVVTFITVSPYVITVAAGPTTTTVAPTTTTAAPTTTTAAPTTTTVAPTTTAGP